MAFIKNYFYYVISILGIGLLIFTLSEVMKLEDKEYLLYVIKSQKNISQKSFQIDKYTQEYIKQKVESIQDELKRKETITKLSNEKETKFYFYFKKNFTNFFISADFSDSEQNKCRLVVKSSFVLISLLNSQNLFVKQNHREHEINKEICNSLYGYGTPI